LGKGVARKSTSKGRRTWKRINTGLSKTARQKPDKIKRSTEVKLEINQKRSKSLSTQGKGVKIEGK